MDGRSYNAGQADNRYKFTAKEKDTETGNDWLDSRGYDSRIGRFFCVDALSELFPGHSSYSYSFNNPISFSDANGMSPDSVNGEAEFPRIVEMEPVEVRADIVPVRYLAVTPLTPRHFIQNLFSSGEVGSQRTYSQENGRWWSYIDLRNQIQVNNMVLPEWVGAVGPSGILSGLRHASIGLKALFQGGSIRGNTIIAIRDMLLKNGFKQSLSENRRGYLFKNASGEEIRLMRSRIGDWVIRVRNSADNYLDEFGNVAKTRAGSHGINISPK